MELIFLGTSCMVPTADRNHQAILLLYNTEGILVDCGEGTQRQLKVADIKPTRITKILISHWHGDHVLGLPGLLQTLNASGYERTLEIYGPPGTKRYMKKMLEAFVFDNNLTIKVSEIKKRLFFENDDFYMEAIPLEHRIPTLGFRIIEKDRRRIKVPFIKKAGIPEGPLLGRLQDNHSIEWNGKRISPEDATYIVPGRKVAFINDTQYCNGCNEVAKDADLLVCEAAYSSKLEEKAREYMHLTARVAAQIASQNNVKELILTHFSQRYKTSEEILEDARDVFPGAVCAHDLMKKRL